MKKTKHIQGSAEEKLVSQFDAWMQKNKQDFIADLVRLVNIKSVNEGKEGGFPFGSGPARCLDAALEIGKRFGLRTENHEYYIGSVILDGEEPDEFGIVGHLDIVPEGNDWHWPPYQATVKDGYVIGRGSSDNKGAVMTALYTLKYLKEAGIRPKHTMRVLLGCNEESGMEDVTYYKTHYTPPMLSLCCDTGFPFHYGEKGRYVAKLRAQIDTSEILELSGGTSVGSIADEAHIIVTGNAAKKADSVKAENDVQVEERADGAVVITAKGRAGHTAFPEGTVNAIQKLAKAVADAQLFQGKNLTVFEFLASAFSDYYGEGLTIAFEDEPSGKLTHAGGMLRLQNGILEQSLNVRYPITLPNANEIKRRLMQVCQQAGFRVENEEDDTPFYIPLDMPVLQLLERTCNEFLELDGDKPFVMRGGTHCRKFPNLVGYGPFLQTTEAREAQKCFGGAHGPDEAVLLKSLYDAVCVYAVTLMRLDTLPQSDFNFNTGCGR